MLHLFMSKRHHCVVIVIAEISITFYYENSTMDQISYDHKLWRRHNALSYRAVLHDDTLVWDEQSFQRLDDSS